MKAAFSLLIARPTGSDIIEANVNTSAASNPSRWTRTSGNRPRGARSASLQNSLMLVTFNPGDLYLPGLQFYPLDLLP
jgi:hypothetical protein